MYSDIEKGYVVGFGMSAHWRSNPLTHVSLKWEGSLCVFRLFLYLARDKIDIQS